VKFICQSIEGLVLIRPEVFEDNRGAFRRNFCAKELKANGIEFSVSQGNISENTSMFTLRGFHYQRKPSNESKVLTPITGGIHNVVIDLRPDSSTFLKSVSLDVLSSSRESLHVPAGCANAFLTIEANTVVHYYMSDYFKPESYAGFRYNDPYFNVQWPHAPAVISGRDAAFSDFSLEGL
jgi:dTDP-4-dehydrorhamnose 3,5-epimerase